MYVLAYSICFVMGIIVMDHFARKTADSDLMKSLAEDMRRIFGDIDAPVSLALAEHEAQMEALNGLMVDDDPDLNDPFRPD